MPDLSPWRVRWSNFRGYEKATTIDLPAMTLLIGRNNAGKTTAYSPLLLLRQTLRARIPETALLFRGDLVDFGSYEEVVTDHDVSRQIAMYLDLGPVWRLASYQHGQNIPTPRALEVTFEASSLHTADLAKSSVQDVDGKLIVSRSRQNTGDYTVVSPLLPRSNEVGRPLREVSQLRQNIRKEKPEGFFFSGIEGIRLPASWRQDRDRWEKVQGWYRACSDIYDIYMEINYHIQDCLTGISYIGPLRCSPQRSYLTSAEPPIDVGRDGQWAPEVLYQSSRGGNSDVLDRANEWLNRLGYGNLGFNHLGDYFQVLVEKHDSDVKVNLADCGAGLSQLLPLLVQGCVMAPRDTLIAQQPEIHLNPAQQDLITDFLIELCESGRRVIIETHSEHVLSRLRRRIAEGNSIDNDEVALYFSEAIKGRSSLRRIPIGEWGEVSPREWPQGFFGEQLENSLKMALAQSRRKRETVRSEA
jgi:predicted ATPase